ncbi:choice-of-anchor I family protein [Paenibacillus sp. GSMTC-2017]|uniref:choice-of-anchor I family protein n=1 Tax=Paenibacillus sp. GSMTC-2017 TaxID=2794350 RepID=UPI0018D6BD2D|nr:choice-of-anchor I family protein [Paenibacillus sp. GSMTC-2017]MBH5317577.1 choice-of-anchor I family protein [Paenibacillus sp. GSMTC-2017]
MSKWKKSFIVLLLTTTMLAGTISVNAVSVNNRYTATNELTLHKIARYNSGKEAIGKNGVEISVYDAATKRVFAVNGDKRSIDILDLSRLTNTSKKVTALSKNQQILIQQLGEPAFDDVTSIAIHPKHDLLAVAVVNKKPLKGHIAFFNKNGKYINKVEVGYHPDMVSFTPDGKKLVVANEGEPSDDYAVDPLGSVSIITVSGAAGTIKQQHVTDVTFQSVKESQIDQNVRIYPHQNGEYQKSTSTPNGNNWATDFEPEYIAVDASSKFAYVVLQENNAIAKLDLNRKSFVHVNGLGYKDHSLPGNGLDVSDKDGGVNIKNWPLLGTYMPDGITLYSANGKTYLVSANEGDSRDYATPNKWSEETTVGKLDMSLLKLNADHYKGYTQEQLDLLVKESLTEDKLGKLKVSTAPFDVLNGETGTAVHDALYTFGARSFSIWDVENFDDGPVFDSGDSFEQIIAKQFPTGFNSDNEKSDSKDKRSTSKGPEPEDVKVAKLFGQQYAFVSLERVGGIMTYNVTNPKAAQYVTYTNDRNFAVADTEQDLGPEGLHIVEADKSPTGTPLLLVANETSGSLSVYEIRPKTKK